MYQKLLGVLSLVNNKWLGVCCTEERDEKRRKRIRKDDEDDREEEDDDDDQKGNSLEFWVQELFLVRRGIDDGAKRKFYYLFYSNFLTVTLLYFVNCNQILF